MIWASKGKAARHTFNYDLINSLNSEGQLSSVWRIPTVAMAEKRQGYHPTQKPLKLLRRALLASSGEGDLLFDPFCGSGTTAVAAKELDRFFVGAEMEAEYCELAARRIWAAERGGVLREILASLPVAAPGTPSPSEVWELYMVGVRPPKRIYREMYLRTRECAASPEPTSIRPTMTMGTASGGPPVLFRAAPVLGSALALAVGLALADAPAVALVLALALAVALALALPPE